MPTSFEWEVVIVDNNSTDQTAEIVQDYSSRYAGRFRYLFERQQGLSFARNAGVRESHGEIVVFTDDDVIVEPTWLWNLVTSLQNNESAGAAGRIVPIWSRPKPRWMDLENPNVSGLVVAFDLGPVALPLKETPFGANMAFRRRVFDIYGGFRTDLGRSGANLLCSEEKEFCQRLLAGGEHLLYEPSAVVHHPVPEERMQKSYLVAWWYGYAISEVRVTGPRTEGKWCLYGVPLRSFCSLGRWSMQWLISIGELRRLECRRNMSLVAGTIVGCYQWWRAHRSQAVSAIMDTEKNTEGNSVQTNSGS